ncbi:serine/threonine protein kinase [Streptomyces sp. NPDC091268]|uniref:serine/threonine protein kinase n=1 Tax=Streptomyces sp. NPDC091268 TaxID=3365979 RepID=UPI003824CD18
MTSQNLHIGPDAAADRYRLLRSIGRGGEAVLYLAEIELAGGSEPVVVKVLDSKTTITPDVFDRISRKWHEQAELLRFVHRPGVVGVREHFEGPPIHRPGESATLTGRALVLVMNHVDGLDLRDWRAERTLATAAERREVMRTLEQLADVLDWLHSGKATPSGRQVIHGDLSPGNVMVDAYGQATLVDFGLSKLTADHQTAEVWFTPGYAAPEVFDGKRTPGTDRYAFGAIAYFLLSGQSPPATPEQLAHALAGLPQIAALDSEQRSRITSICAADAGKRPVSLAGWMKDVRHAVVSTTTSTSGRVVRDAVPAKPVLPPHPVAPPPPATPPPGYTPTATPTQAPPPTPQPEPQPEPVPLPLPLPLPESGPNSRPAPTASVPPGYGPAYDLTPAPTPTPTPPAPPPPPKKKRRTAAVLGIAVLVAALTAGALWGISRMGDPGSRKGARSAEPAAGATSPRPSDPASPSPAESDGPSPAPSTEPSAGGSVPSRSTPGPGAGSNLADLTVLTPVNGLGEFDVSPAKLNTVLFGATFSATPSCNTDAYTEFDLNREWKTLEFTAGIDDGSHYENGRLTISLDDRPAVFSELLQLGKPLTRTIPVEGALRLRVKAEKSCRNGEIVLAAPTLKR